MPLLQSASTYFLNCKILRTTSSTAGGTNLRMSSARDATWQPLMHPCQTVSLECCTKLYIAKTCSRGSKLKQEVSQTWPTS